MPSGELGADALVILQALAGERADRYVSDILLPALQKATNSPDALAPTLRERFADPHCCLRTIYAHYAFARRGKDRTELAELAVEALERACTEQEFESLLQEPDAEAIWDMFVMLCEERRRKPMEQLNRGAIAGIAELAQEIYQLDGVGSIAGWVEEGLMRTSRLEPQFLRMVDVRGVGPKLAAFFIRDVVFLFGLEEQIDHADRLFVQPIDKWLRLLAPKIVEEVNSDDATPDWVLAGKLAKYARRAGVSGIRFNMGATYFGAREVRDPEKFESALALLR